MKFKNFFIAFSVLTISMPAMAMKQSDLKEKDKFTGMSESYLTQRFLFRPRESLWMYELGGNTVKKLIPELEKLLTYIYKGNQEGVIEVLKNNIDLIDEIPEGYYYSPLGLCVAEGKMGLAEIFLKKGSNPNIKNKAGMTVLDIAEKERKSPEIINLLKSYGAKNGYQ